jgi:hypothetical protein
MCQRRAQFASANLRLTDFCVLIIFTSPLELTSALSEFRLRDRYLTGNENSILPMSRLSNFLVSASVDDRYLLRNLGLLDVFVCLLV